MYQSKNKIVDYYQPNDERLSEYYLGHAKLLGLDKQPFGLDQHGVLRFEQGETKSQIWADYISNGNFQQGVGDYNKLWIDFQRGKYTLEDFMQFYREDGSSLSHFIDTFSTRFYMIEDANKFQRALDKLKDTKDLVEAKQDILDMIFLAHLDSVEEAIIFNYRKQAKKIIDTNFGPEAWDEFVQSIKKQHNE
jgi:hypothetical protein